MCLGHNDVSFKAFVAAMEKAKKDKEKKEKEDSKEVSNFAADQEENEDESTRNLMEKSNSTM